MILITEEDSRQIKEMVSDINEKAFYGKLLKKTKDLNLLPDDDVKNLSPRAREIASVMKFIKNCKLILYNIL